MERAAAADDKLVGGLARLHAQRQVALQLALQSLLPIALRFIKCPDLQKADLIPRQYSIALRSRSWNLHRMSVSLAYSFELSRGCTQRLAGRRTAPGRMSTWGQILMVLRKSFKAHE